MADAAPPPHELKWTARLHRMSGYLPSRGRFLGGATQGLMSAAAAMVAYLPAKPLGLQEGFWGSITAIAVVASMTVCWLLNVVSAARLAGSTATIICLVPHQRSTEWMMVSRIVEVGWGVAVGVATVWLVNRVKAWSESRRAAPTQGGEDDRALRD